MQKYDSVHALVTALSRDVVARARRNDPADDSNDELLADARVCVDYGPYQAVRQLACEEAAQRWLAYASHIIPRRFQTEEYATAVRSRGLPRGASRELPAHRRCESRPVLVLDRLLLNRVHDSPAVMEAQFAHLQNLADQEKAAVRIVDGLPIGTLVELYYGPNVLYVSEGFELTVYRAGPYESALLGFDLAELLGRAQSEYDSYKALDQARASMAGGAV